jgi:cyanophycinase-like exopeptidase
MNVYACMYMHMYVSLRASALISCITWCICLCFIKVVSIALAVVLGVQVATQTDCPLIPTPTNGGMIIQDGTMLRMLIGNPEDVMVPPAVLGGPFLVLDGGDDVWSALQAAVNQVRGCDECDTKIDVVVLLSAHFYIQYYSGLLFGLDGVDSVETLMINVTSDSSREDVFKTIQNAELVYFGGGDQCRYINYFRGTPVEAAVEVVFTRGGAVGGTSAGLAIQGEYIYDACYPEHGTWSEMALMNPYNESVSFSYDFFLWPGMANTLTETHFYERDRMGRLFTFLARQIQDGVTDHVLGVAVDEVANALVNSSQIATIYGKCADTHVYMVLADHMPEVST